MKLKKKMYVYFNEKEAGENEFFFDNKSLITVIHGNDGHYRDEYMNILFEHFNISVCRIKSLNSLQKKEYQKYIKENLS